MENYNNPSQPIPPEKDGVRARKSIWKWILLYVLIGAVAYGLIYYFFFFNKNSYNISPQNYQTNTQNQTPKTQNETAGWETYTNAQYGFEFKYPPNTNVIENPSSRPDKESFFGIYNIPFLVKPTDSGSKDFYISVAPSPVAYCDNGLLSDKKVNINGIDFHYVSNSFKVKDQNWTHIKIYSIDRNNICYALFLRFIGSYNANGNFIVTPGDNVTKPNYDFYYENKILESIRDTFKFTNIKVSDDFTYAIGDTYSHEKEVLKGNGWMPIITTTTSVDVQFPEIGNCGSGVDAICSVDFQKGTYKNHLNIQSRTNGWVVVGNE